mgnify:FL=1
MSHPGVGAYLLELWGVPAPLVEIVGSHHSLDLCSRRSVACRIVYGADWVCNGADEQVLEREVRTAEHPERALQLQRELLGWKVSKLDKVGAE